MTRIEFASKYLEIAESEQRVIQSGKAGFSIYIEFSVTSPYRHNPSANGTLVTPISYKLTPTHSTSKKFLAHFGSIGENTPWFVVRLGT